MKQLATPNTTTITAPTLEIFLSCRSEDVDAATKIAAQFELLGQSRLKVFVQDEVPFGEKYRPHVLRRLASANRLILLYNDPDQNWDACLYESGFFDGRGFPNNKLRLIVLHDETCEPPNPLKEFYPVKISRSNKEPLRTFIHQMFVESPDTGLEPLKADLMEDRYAANRELLENAIIDAVSGSQERYFAFAKEILIQIPDVALDKSLDFEVPNEARVFGDLESFKLFDLRAMEKGYPWAEFYEAMDRVSDHTDDWVGSLSEMMKRVAFSNVALDSTGLPLYRARIQNLSRVYRPSIRSFRKRKGSLSFKVVFTDLPQETTAEPEGVATTLAQALTAARMFRWGVLQPLKENVADLNRRLADGKISPEEWFRSMASEFHRFIGQKLTVLVEALNRGYQRDELKRSLKDSRTAIAEILDSWDSFCVEAKELADRLRSNDDKITSDIVIGKAELALELNKRFMVLCAERYKEALENL